MEETRPKCALCSDSAAEGEALCDWCADTRDGYDWMQARAKEKAAQWHRGFHFERLNYSDCLSTRMERAFAEQWLKENDPTERQFPILRSLMVDQSKVTGFGIVFGIAEYHTEITERDAQIVATVIQWLGTNVGRAFLEAALRRASYQLKPVE